MTIKLFVDIVLLLSRSLASLLMLHHGIEKLSDIDGFTSFIVDNYFSYLPFEHSYWTYLAAYTQIIGSFLLVIGIFTRLSLVGLCSTMLFALIFHFSDTGLQGAPFGIVSTHNYEFEASLLYLILYALLLINGPGKLSLIVVMQGKISNATLRWLK
ncbi:MAG: DoxX subfamily protein [Cyanobium sp. MED195]|nr:DoxX subfamily protein [Cyanobium sp. MED195]